MRANCSASYSYAISLNLLKYEANTVPDWNPEFLYACVTKHFFVIPLSACSPPRLSLCLFAKAFLYTFPELTNAWAKTTTDYIKKATAVTADSMMVYSSTLNPMFWGLILHVWVCYCTLCGCSLDFVIWVFSWFENTLWWEISHLLQRPIMWYSRLKPWLNIAGTEDRQSTPSNSPSFLPLQCAVLTPALFIDAVLLGAQKTKH